MRLHKKVFAFLSHASFLAAYRVRRVGRFQAICVSQNAFQRSKP
jgi:hypothetical protein